MFTLNGKYGEATVFTDIVDNESIAQVISLLNQPYAQDAHVRLMPDIHAGAGCTIGTTMRIHDKVCPNLVGVDIGCGMEVLRIAEKSVDFEKLDRIIRAEVPSGFNIRETPHPFLAKIDLTGLKCFSDIDETRASNSIGTLGGGNHFIEMNTDNAGNYYLVVHSGSRHLGTEIAKHYQNRAWSEMTQYSPAEIQDIIKTMKSEGRQKEIQQVLNQLSPKQAKTPKDLAYVEGEALSDYLHDMQIAQSFAMLNRQAICDTITTAMGWATVESFTTIHNYIDIPNRMLRKGAVSAQKDEKLIIPMNMRDGSLICLGKGNPDWNYSAPHGAGRLFSRSKAKELFTVAEFESEMSGIYTTSVGQSTLDESPMAYKNPKDIIGNIQDTVEIINIIKPVYNFKAGE